MWIGLVIALCGAASQSDVVFSGPVPRDVPTYEVILSGSDPFHAGIRIGGQWVTDRNQEIRPHQRVEFVPDTPYYMHAPIETSMRNVTLNYEAPAMRRARLERQWEELGYAFIETEAGWRPVKREDIELAERARQLAVAAQVVAEASAAAEYAPSGEGAVSRLGRGALFAARAAIVMAGVAAALGVALLMARGGEGWRQVE